MKLKNVIAAAIGVVIALNLTSCAVYRQNAPVVFSEYCAATVTPTSAGDKDANYDVLEPVIATASVEYTPGGYYSNRQIHIDGQLIYDYEANQPNEQGQWLKNFNATQLELGFPAGSTDSNNVTHPDPKALARQLAYAKVFKKVMEVGGDAITTPIISTIVDGKTYTTTIKAYIIKLHPTK
ncbi:MAG: hypothetical protein NC301_07795 [Bacteroides sp.]|nr:hypothetical protein [Bacteroides sp.]MCM1380073.1 hypothetical protein [Bacteroides sp.]MCM1446410.1 hypothetical protein [Prevotella sp.]